MLSVRLLALRIEGFKSFRAETVIEFPREGGFRFLSGRNEVEPRLGPNGAGKTSLWDALAWCLYGCSVLGDRTSELTNWTAKRASVTVALELGENYTEISRQGSPERLFIFADPATQEDFNDLLGLTRTQFLQSVIFGQRATMFFDLPIPARGALLDECLDLALWTRASDQATVRVRNLEAGLRDHERQQAHEQGRLAGLSNPDELRIREEAWEQERNAKIEAGLCEIEQVELRIAERERELAALGRHLPPDKTKLNALHEEVDRLRSARDQDRGRAGAYRKQEQLFRSNPKQCPTCLQAITPDLVAKQLHHFECLAIADRLDMEVVTKQLKQVLDDYEAELRHVQRIEAEGEAQRIAVARLTGIISGDARYLAKAVSLVEQLIADDHNPFTAQLAARAASAAEIDANLTRFAELIDRTKVARAKAEFWIQGFKRVRLYLIQRVLLQLEIDTANAASLLGIGNWRIKYATEVETKSGGLKHGVQIRTFAPDRETHVALPSGGEGQRLRLAVEMGLAATIQRLSGVSYSFEVWDEPSAFLSDEGLEDLLESLRYRAQSTNKSLWLTDHRTYSYNFDSVWTVVKTANGSTIEDGATLCPTKVST